MQLTPCLMLIPVNKTSNSATIYIVNQEGGKILAEFPNNIELWEFGPGQDPVRPLFLRSNPTV
ncbi:unnamed protein product [Brassica oleracea]|uniref:(rape) hypothetical protein n=1 Tax=Brassica napus TaxID=3708 RepID=A0A816VCE8_BRANA|nr:unnamed protein product [Brassica napus]